MSFVLRFNVFLILFIFGAGASAAAFSDNCSFQEFRKMLGSLVGPMQTSAVNRALTSEQMLFEIDSLSPGSHFISVWDKSSGEPGHIAFGMGSDAKYRDDLGRVLDRGRTYPRRRGHIILAVDANFIPRGLPGGETGSARFAAFTPVCGATARVEENGELFVSFFSRGTNGLTIHGKGQLWNSTREKYARAISLALKKTVRYETSNGKEITITPP